MTLPHLFPFSSQGGQLKASDEYFPPEVTRTLLYGPKAQYLTSSCTQQQLKANILKLANFLFTVIYNHRKQVLMKFIFNIASSPMSCFQVGTSWISSTCLIQPDLQAPTPCQSSQRWEFRACSPTSRFQKWNFFFP